MRPFANDIMDAAFKASQELLEDHAAKTQRTPKFIRNGKKQDKRVFAGLKQQKQHMQDTLFLNFNLRNRRQPIVKYFFTMLVESWSSSLGCLGSSVQRKRERESIDGGVQCDRMCMRHDSSALLGFFQSIRNAHNKFNGYMICTKFLSPIFLGLRSKHRDEDFIQHFSVLNSCWIRLKTRIPLSVTHSSI